MVNHKLVLMQTSPYERIRGKKKKARIRSTNNWGNGITCNTIFIIMFNVLKGKFESMHKTTRGIIINQATC